MKSVIFLIFAIFIPFFSHASAWIPDPGKYKILTQFEIKKFADKRKDAYDPRKEHYTIYEALNLKLNIERGLSRDFSALYELNTHHLLSHKYYRLENGIPTIAQKYQSNYKMPLKYSSQSVGLKAKLYANDLSIISFQTQIRHLQQERYEIENKLMLAKSWKYRNNYSFFQTEFSYLEAINSLEDSFKIDFTYGLRRSAKKIYLLQLLNYVRINSYDPISKHSVKSHKRYVESKLQFSTAKKITDNLYFQKGAYANLNGRKFLESGGVTFGLWIDL